MNQHGPRPTLRRMDGHSLKGVPLTAVNDAHNHTHDLVHCHDHKHDTKTAITTTSTTTIGLGAPDIVTGSGVGTNTTAPRHGVHSGKKKGQRPTSLSLTVAGEWIQRGVKTLGGMSPWSSSTGVGKRFSMSGLPGSTAVVGSGSAPRRWMEDPRQGESVEGTMSTATPPQEVEVPQSLQEGTWMTKVSGKKQKKMFLRLDPDMGHIIWHSKQPRISPYFLPSITFFYRAEG